ncbi:MAG: glucosyltransferase domain-containing protein [Syntrophales bacterium]
MSFDYRMRQPFRQEIKLFAVGFAISLVAKGIALFPLGFSIDSYMQLVLMSDGPPADALGIAHFMSRRVLAEGRIGQWALNQILIALGIVGPGGNTLYVVLALCCYVGVGILLCRLWRIEDSLGIQVCIVCIFALHPYNADVFTFREGTFTVGLGLLLGMLGLTTADRRLSRWAAGCILMVLSLTLYQVAINFIVIALVILALLELTRLGPQGILGGIGLDVRRQFLQQLLPRASALVAAVVIYTPLYKLSLHLAGRLMQEHSRGAIVPLSEIPERIWRSTIAVGYVFLVPGREMPVVVKLLIVGLSALAIGLMARKIWEIVGYRRYMMFALAFSLLAIAGLAIVGVVIPLKEWSEVHRALAGVSVLVAGFFALAISNGGVWSRRAALAVAGVLLFSFAGVSNVVLSEQLRLNHRDMATAGRMISRLEANPKFAAVKKIAVIGRQSNYARRFLTSEYKSAFGRAHSKANILQEVSGYRFQEPDSDERRRAEDYCRDVRPWPDPASVTVLEDTAVICLPERE